MNEAAFNISLTNCKKILKNLRLLKATYDKRGKYSDEFLEVSRKEKYLDIYNTGINNLDYDFLLSDDSFLQFSYNNRKNIRYAYYQMPYDVPTYEQYLINQGFDYTEIGEYFREEYDQETIEAPLNSGALIFRYEFSIREYVSGVHPASHLHIGLNNHCRIPVAYYLSPTMFVIFILKQIYYESWKNFLKKYKFIE